jgi:peptidoglycan hydrolase-like protein with peptidoglycan-binding domain
MRVWWAAWAAIAISLAALQASAVEATVNSPEQIRKAQVELQRLDCLKGRVDGKLGEQTRQAIRKFWKSAAKPVVDVVITDELISDLTDRGAGFCRPARRFFAVGGPVRPGGPPPSMRGARPPAQPPAPAQ